MNRMLSLFKQDQPVHRQLDPRLMEIGSQKHHGTVLISYMRKFVSDLLYESLFPVYVIL